MQGDVAQREGNTSNKDPQENEEDLPKPKLRTSKRKRGSDPVGVVAASVVVEKKKKVEVRKPPPRRQTRITRNKYPCGTSVSKVFVDDKNGTKRAFSGSIIGYDKKDKLYKVKYDDGDEEELDEGDLTKIVVIDNIKKGNSAAAPKDTGKGGKGKKQTKLTVIKSKKEWKVVTSDTNTAAASKPTASLSDKPKAEEKTVIRGLKLTKITKPAPKKIKAVTPDIDKDDHDKPQCHSRYVEDMYDNYRAKEREYSTKPTYMVDQPTINDKMRAILVDWLIEVHSKFGLAPDSLYLTVNIIDRFLSKNMISRPRLQLAGVTAFMIATKFEEVWPPEIRDLVYICDKSYSKLELIDMEATILKKLEWAVACVPNACAFVTRFLKVAKASKKTSQVANYILDGTLSSYKLLNYRPSQLAAAAVLIARRNTGELTDWNKTLSEYTQYKREEVVPVARAILNEKAATPATLKAVKTKHGSEKYGEVSNMSIQLSI